MFKDTSRSNLPYGQGFGSGLRSGSASFAALLVLLLIRPAITPGQKPAPGDFTISTSVHLVLLDVSVKDSHGYVSGLGKESFQIYENGVLQRITEFSSADEPVAIGLVMDNSGSMRSRIAHVIAAGVEFIGASNPQDQMFVVNFNDNVQFGLKPDIPFTGDISLLRSALSKNRPDGQTALYDAVATALAHLEGGQRARKAILLVSDGGDTCSRRKLKEVIQLVQESRATLYTIGIFDDNDPDRNPGVLQRLSAISGGESFLPKSLDEITPVCRKIATDIRKRYTVGYIPTRSGVAGVRKLRVVATAPQHGKLTVQTRTSYQSPGAE